MSGFLGRLARRSVRPVADIRPRLPSRFEPGADDRGIGDPGPVDGLEEMDAISESEGMSPQVTPRRTNRRRSSPPDESRRVASDPEPAEPSRSRRDQSTAPAPPSSGRTEIEDAHAAAPPRPAAPLRAGEAGATSPEQPAAVPIPEPRDRDRPETPRATKPAGPPPPDDRAPELVPSAAPAAVDRLELRPTERARPPTIEPILPAPGFLASVPTRPPAGADPSSVAATAAPRAIEVSIGRIDVRAVFSPAPAPPPAPSVGPTLLLDDYLEQRESGRL